VVEMRWEKERLTKGLKCPGKRGKAAIDGRSTHTLVEILVYLPLRRGGRKGVL